MALYFAYGSNMDQNQMQERCPSAALLGPATLADYRLAFTIFSPKRQCGCADVVASSGDTVHGLLYELTDADLVALDGFEGHPDHYQRTTITVAGQDGRVVAYSYEVVDKQEHVVPSAHYLGLMQTAASLHNFSDAYQAFLKGTATLD